MPVHNQASQGKFRRTKVFDYWLRTGIQLVLDDAGYVIERKFNPYHDPDDGRFTFAPGGGTLPPRASRAGGNPVGARMRQRKPRSDSDDQSFGPEDGSNEAGNDRFADDPHAQLILANYRLRPATGPGHNSRSPINDPMTLDRVFPGVATMSPSAIRPANAVIAMADNILDITGPGARLTSGLAVQHTNTLLRQIREVDPSFRHESLGFPQTIDGQVNLIRHLRVERAVVFHRVRGELHPMQVEALRQMQEQTDRAYDRAVARYNSGRLRVRLSPEEAIGNYIDREVRIQLREFYNRYGVETSTNGPFRIIGREYASSGSDRTYRIPDARIGNIAFDVSLTRKTIATPQVRGFFEADFRPEAVVIIRPRQLGQGSTYRINHPGK